MEEEIKRYTEELYNEIFGNGQGTVDEFDWEDIAQTIEETAHHFANWQKEQQPHWKPSEEQMDWLESAVKLSIDKPHIHGIIISLYEQLKRL